MFEQCEFGNTSTNAAKHIEIDYSQLFTIKQFCIAFPWPSEAAMRSYIYRAEELGISEAFVRVGRRVLIMPQKFFDLIKKLDSSFKNGGLNETVRKQKREEN